MDEPQKQSSRVLRDTLLAKLLGAQLVLSFTESPVRRDIPSKVAWIALNFKSMCTIIGHTATPREPVPRPGELDMVFLSKRI